MKKIAFVFSFFAFLILIRPPFVSAKEFSSFYKTSYKFSPAGEAFVTQEVSLINLSADYYVSEYTLSILGGKVEKIEAFDQVGPLAVKTSLQGENTLITLRFNEKVVGKDKMLSFILKYQIADLAKKEGNLWQISLPKLAQYANIDDYQVSVSVPAEMGKIAYVNPSPTEELSEENQTILKFGKRELIDFGALITVGQYQTFNFKIGYELKNDSSSTKEEKIALPPDTDYQEVFYRTLQPKPDGMEKDGDGNWLAIYRLSSQQKLSIIAEGQANIFFKSRNTSPGQIESDSFLKATKYWPADDPKIIKLSRELITPEKIYRYVVKNLEYDYQLVKRGNLRKGALGVLEKPRQSVCSDFTDLFIALCRAAGIPAREMAGYGFSDNPKFKELSQSSDLLHSWPEYFDQKTQSWIMVDPTWEKTSGGLDYFDQFDMAHFVFVVHGKSDSLPLPPGSYSLPENDGKQVFVTLGKENTASRQPVFSLSRISPKTVFSLKKNRVEVELANDSGFTVRRPVVSLQGQGKTDPSAWNFDEVLPFAKVKIAFFLTPRETFKDYFSIISINIGTQSLAVSQGVVSLALRLSLFVGGILILVLAAVLWRYRKKEKKENLPARGEKC